MLPMTHKERFDSLGIKPPKGVLLYGPPGTGKTLMARACAAQTNATYLKLAGPQLVQVISCSQLIAWSIFSNTCKYNLSLMGGLTTISLVFAADLLRCSSEMVQSLLGTRFS